MNYSTLNEKNMELGIQPGYGISEKYREYRISGDIAKDMKGGKYTGII